MRPILFVAAFTLLFYVACKKSSTTDNNNNNTTTNPPPPPPPPTHTQLVTAHPWKYNSGKVHTAFGDTTLPIQACRIDNSYTFVPGGTGTMDEGATKCASTDPQTSPFTWSLSQPDSMTITLNGAAFFGVGGSFKIVTLNDTLFTLSKDTTITYSGFPIAATATINMKH